MAAVTLILLLLAVAAGLYLLARWINVPHPVLLVIGGLVLALMPGLPHARLDPDIIFLIFVPPLLYRAAITTSWRDFRANLRSILLLAIGLVIATIITIAIVAHRLVSLSWPAAFLLGAIVAPPDPVAATAVMRELNAPPVIDTILEGEGLVNDATALIAYRQGVEAVTSGQFHLGTTTIRFVIAAVGGVAIGLAVGAVIGWLRRHIEHSPEVENTISLLTPFVAYLPADHLGLSGVLAVVAVGLYLGREGPKIVSPETRVQAAGVWDLATFLLEGLIFILIGLELPLVKADLPNGELIRLTVDGILISLAAIIVRLMWMFPGAYLPRRFDAWRGQDPNYPRWQYVLFIGWAGMRGADSLVIALALPLETAKGHPFPERSAIIYLTFIVILVTLVAQGLTLQPIIRWLGLHGEGADEIEQEETLARLRVTQAGLARLDRIIKQSKDRVLVNAAHELRGHHVHRLHRYEARHRHRRHNRDEALNEAFKKARAEMIAAERRQLVKLRDEGAIGDDVMRRVQRDLDLEQMLVGASEESLESLEDAPG
jgi:Na+/H+ antiporter